MVTKKINFNSAQYIIALKISNKEVLYHLKSIYQFEKIKSPVNLTIEIKITSHIVVITTKNLTIQFDIRPHKNSYLQAIDHIIRYIIELQLHKIGIFFLHSSSYLYKDKTYVFTGQSGAGKTTILFNMGKKYRISEDISMIQKTKEGFMVSSNPYEKNRDISHQKMFSHLGTIYTIVQSSHNKVIEVSLIERLKVLLYNNIVIAGLDTSYNVKVNDPNKIILKAKSTALKLFLEVINNVRISQLHFIKSFTIKDLHI